MRRKNLDDWNVPVRNLYSGSTSRGCMGWGAWDGDPPLGKQGVGDIIPFRAGEHFVFHSPWFYGRIWLLLGGCRCWCLCGVHIPGSNNQLSAAAGGASQSIVSTIVSTSTIVNSQHPPRFNRGSWRRHPRSTCLRHLTNQPINFSAVNWTLKPKSTTQNTTWSSTSNTHVNSRNYPYPVCLLSLLGIQIGCCIAKRSSELGNFIR